MTDNRTTELRGKLDKLGIEHVDASYKRKVPITVWQSNGATFCFVDSSNQTDLHIENPTPEQAIAATLGKPEIVRCRDCIYGTHFFHHDDERWQCANPYQDGDNVKPDAYCWRGKRKEGGE